MKILIIGSGGREDALALALLRDPEVSELHVAPGNAGTAGIATNHPVAAADPAAVTALARELAVDLVVIGPEVPLVAGVADAVRAAGIDCFGPSREAAMIEGSKAFAKEVMAEAAVPTARSQVCITLEQVAAAIDAFGAPYVVKDDGLAAGKGVIVTSDRLAALDHAAQALARPGGGAVVVEEYLDGPEVSLFAITDGRTALPLLPAADFKRVGDGDTGPNTGGMGAYAPLPWAPAGLVSAVMERVIEPTVAAMRERGTPFRGLLYAGLALTSRGLRVVEFNARFGDPETQVVLPLLRSPLGGLLRAAARGELAEYPALNWDAGSAVTVVLASAGYPTQPGPSEIITGPSELLMARDDADAWVVHAGTVVDGAGKLASNGGRVLCVTARGADLAQARTRAYQAISLVDLPGGHYRRDIAAAAVEGRIAPPDL
ncbi:MAG: phosphoribosylamine--glycine ligase [Candidatus Nanopelagicales bacterium]